MILRQYPLACLSLYSYLIADETTGRAVVIDPQRDISVYLEDAAALGVRIERVVETHFHADFLSGHLELAEATGAVISYGDAGKGQAEYEVDWLADGQRLSLGEVTLECLATPGHTPESICVAVYEHPSDAAPAAVLTGDTLFIGDVGRPDLLGGFGISAEELGRSLYRSLREKLLTLPDAVQVYPAHGAGSACGKQLSTAAVSTIGEQRAGNYALQDMTEERFVDIVTAGQPAVPGYFPFDAVTNRKLRAVFDETDAVAVLTLDDVLARAAAGAALVDGREPAHFAAGHLRGAINVAIDGRFAEQVGQVVPVGTPIVLVGDPATAAEARTRLARIGFDDVVGQLAEPLAAMAARPDVVERSSRLNVHELATARHLDAKPVIVDVRNPGEVEMTGTIHGALTIPLAQLDARRTELDPAAPTVVVCAGGGRSSSAASLLSARGFTDVSDLLGGMNAWIDAGLPATQVAPATTG
ncbi:MAG: MBL fold metallo-hydrolase [Acidimicrobiales bacterium]|nr:MBL fold metallo-hydrolase [Acidimicrobiales bacterium]